MLIFVLCVFAFMPGFSVLVSALFGVLNLLKLLSILPLLGTYMRSWDRPEIDRYLRVRGSSLVNLVPRRGYQDIFLERMGIAQLLYALTRSLG